MAPSGHLHPSTKSGFSLLETLVALAIMAMGAALIMTRASGAISQVTDHSVFFDFQRQVSDLRRRAFHAQGPMVLAAPAEGAQGSTGRFNPAQSVLNAISRGLAQDGAEVLEVALRPGWTYSLSQPMRIDASGQCQNISAELIRDGKSRVHLISQDGACHFIRVVRATE